MTVTGERLFESLDGPRLLGVLIRAGEPTFVFSDSGIANRWLLMQLNRE